MKVEVIKMCNESLIKCNLYENEEGVLYLLMRPLKNAGP